MGLRDIAAACGVSLGTVSLALRGSRRLRAETVARVRAAADALGYDPRLQHAASRMASARTGKRVLSRVIALFYPVLFFSAPYFVRLFRGLQKEVAEAGFGLLTCPDDLDTWPPPAIVLRGDVDGAVVHVTPKTGAQILELRSRFGFGDRPIVGLINPLADHPAVVSADEEGGYLLASHLLDLGHRRLLFCRVTDWSHQHRLAGYRRACRERGLDPARVLTAVRWWRRSGDEQATAAALAALAAADPPTALLAFNDSHAAQLIRALAARGLRVPHHVSVAGYDDTDPLPGPRGRNALTTVALPLEEMGCAAARCCINLILDGVPGTDDHLTVLPVTLRARGTTGPPPPAGRDTLSDT